jgi:hypothetical protein
MDGRLQLRQTIPDSIDVRMTYVRCVQRSAAQLTESLESWCEGADHYRHELYVTPGKEMRDERCILYRIPSAQCTVSSVQCSGTHSNVVSMLSARYQHANHRTAQ